MFKIRIRCGIAALLQILFLDAFANWRAFGQGAEIDGKLPTYATGLFILASGDGGCGLIAMTHLGKTSKRYQMTTASFRR